MNEEQIKDEARKAANRSQFKSNHKYDHKSYEDGFIEGMKQALGIANVGKRCSKCDIEITKDAECPLFDDCPNNLPYQH